MADSESKGARPQMGASPSPETGPLTFDQLGLAYRTLTPHPFDAEKFYAELDGKFKAEKVQGFTLNVEGVLSGIDKVYTFRKARLNFDPDRGIVGVTGENYADVNDAFGIVRSTLEEELDFDLGEIRYLELVAGGRFKPKGLPVARLSATYDQEALIKLSAFFNGESVTPLTLRVGQADTSETKESLRDLREWFEMRVEPFTINPAFFFWALVYRKRIPSAVMEIWESLESRLTNLMKSLDLD